jgi:proline utilization trans-activator
MKPGISNSDALEILLSILRSMKKDGNIPAVDFCARLSHIQSRVAGLLGASRAQDHVLSTDALRDGQQIADANTEASGHQPGEVSFGSATPTAVGYGGVDILGNPLIESFLDDHRGPWTDTLFLEDGPSKEFASAFEEPFLFHV